MNKIKRIILLIIAIVVCVIAFNACTNEKNSNLPTDLQVQMELNEEAYK